MKTVIVREPAWVHASYGWTGRGYSEAAAVPVSPTWERTVDRVADTCRRMGMPASVYGWIVDPRDARDYPPDVVVDLDENGRAV